MSYCWQKRCVSSFSPPTRFDQYKTLTGLSTLRPEFAPYGITVCRGTLKRLDEAFQGFFRRVKKGQQPGYPRFRSFKRFDSVSWPDVRGWKLDESARRLYLQGVGHVKLNLHRRLCGVPKTLTIRRRGRHLEVTVFCSGFRRTSCQKPGDRSASTSASACSPPPPMGSCRPTRATESSFRSASPRHSARSLAAAAALTATSRPRQGSQGSRRRRRTGGKTPSTS
jgi:hypothetical protein